MCFFNNCTEKNKNKIHFEEDTSESPPLELFRKFISFGGAPLPNRTLSYLEVNNFILSGSHTSLKINIHIHCEKIAVYFSENEGAVEGRLDFFQKFTRFGSAILPLFPDHQYNQRLFGLLSVRQWFGTFF